MPARSRFATVAIVVCDSVGCGDAPDAAAFGDAGANTLGHVIEATSPKLPHLARLGLDRIPGVPPLGGHARPTAAWGRMIERAPGKDTMLGHWELMGVIADRQFPLYPSGFPETVLDAVARIADRPLIGNRPASGVAILEELGAEHLRTGALIVYTSGDSVFQVAAHEGVMPSEELYSVCERAREVLRGEHAVGRVIARPFRGEPGSFQRTSGRRDFPLEPARPTVLQQLQAAGVRTLAIGKIYDIFAGRGIDEYEKTASNAEGIGATCRALSAGRRGLVFTNLVDFDTHFGHRNDVAGYGAALEELDHAIPTMLEALPGDGCLILTADHGNDPTWPGTDHTRECVPLHVAGENVRPVPLGTRATFADLGATIAENFGIDPLPAGESFLADLPGGA